jgi:murein DD-endopeptidase MepM/ murein hydrolase activator NlpD
MLIRKVLALVCMGALLVPSIVAAKATKRSSRAPKAKAVKVARTTVERSGRVVGPSKVTRKASAKRPRVATAGKINKIKRSSKRIARSKSKRAVRQARHGIRGTVDEHLHVRKGDTVENILAARGIGITEAREWIASTADVFDLTKIRPRHGLTLRFDRETHVLESLRYEVDQRNLLVAEQVGENITARLEDLPYFVEVKGIAGRIEHGLREDTIAAGVPARIAADLADIFGWDVDVENGLRTGDEFRVIYENIWQVGMPAPQAGKVLAAELVVGGKRQTAVLFEDADGQGGYYAPTGQAISRDYLRYPVEFTEITSQFSLDRLHPISGQRRPHWGVDLAAPHGTPVRAAANGVVTVSGWESGLGKTVRIGHMRSVDSTYGHLSAIAPAIVPGAQVERGQVIGYIGSTGLSTGPHLHYELARDGEHVDPLEFTCDREPAIEFHLVKQFERSQREVTKQLASIPSTRQPTSLSMSTRVTQAWE